jgi:hypothetical protein
MPLGNCDCYGGCWGDHSENWPSLKIPQDKLDEGAKLNPRYPSSAIGLRICDVAGIPYGSFVIMEDAIRVETETMLVLLKMVLHD